MTLLQNSRGSSVMIITRIKKGETRCCPQHRLGYYGETICNGKSEALRFLRSMSEHLPQRGDFRLEGLLRGKRSRSLRGLRPVREGMPGKRDYTDSAGGERMRPKKHWYDYLWIWSILYFSLGFFNILFAWLGMIDFLLPLAIAVFGRNKWYCNHLCGRGQLFSLLGGKLKLSLNRPTPRLFYSKWFRYGFLIFFMAMFMNLVYQTCLVAGGAESLRETIQLFWSFQVPWGWTYTAGATIPWIAQFSFGFYGLMLTSLILGILFMLLFRPRSWCAFCPMGSMTQAICQLENRKARKEKELIQNTTDKEDVI